MFIIFKGVVAVSLGEYPFMKTCITAGLSLSKGDVSITIYMIYLLRLLGCRFFICVHQAGIIGTIYKSGLCGMCFFIQFKIKIKFEYR